MTVKNPTKKNQEAEITKEDILSGLENPMTPILEKIGIGKSYLAQKLKKELNAKETKVFNDKGELIYSDNLVAWKIRQEARKDAHKLRGDYPAEKREHSGYVTLEEIIKAQDQEEKDG